MSGVNLVEEDPKDMSVGLGGLPNERGVVQLERKPIYWDEGVPPQFYTPTGKIELYSDQIANFAYDDCGGHPRWYDKSEWLGSQQAETYPLHLISNQPKTRLHSQFDHARTSRDAKVHQREILRINPRDAALRQLGDGDIARIFNDRGACLASCGRLAVE